MAKSIIESKMKDIQQVEQQIGLNSAQIESMKVREKELEEAIKELENIEEGEIIYRAAGEILIREKDLGKLKSRLNEEKEVIGIRLNTLTKQQEALYEKYETLQNEVVALVNNNSGGNSG